ncbi:MAG: hypothetical protein AB7O50_14495 [Pseudolabrys sp.]
MTLKKNLLFAGAAIAAMAVSQPAAAQYYYAQPYGQQYGYPYVVVQQPYAATYAPAVRSYPYVVHRPQAYAPQSYAPQPRRIKARKTKLDRAVAPDHADQAAQPRQIHREVSKADPALIEELRRKTGKKISKTIVVRGKPVIVERKRYVDDPPIVIKRHKVVDVTEPSAAPQRVRAGADRGEPRVIRAEAEVTILGPDRMSIRLFRKGTDANAKADDRADETGR